MNQVRVTQAVLDAILHHARTASPAECCGVLLGSCDHIVAAVPTLNLADSPSRFLIDPQGHMDARRHARRLGTDVTGFYHSHVRSSAEPSPRDLAEASYPDHLYLIVSLATRQGDIRLYRLERDQFLEMTLVVGGSDTPT